MRSLSYLKVEGHESLIRDTNSKAIIAIDDREYENYMMKRKLHLQNINKLKEHSEEIQSIKKDLSEIKNLLIKMIEEK